MPKINIQATIKNVSDNSIVKTSAIIQDDTIKYKEDDKTIVKFNYRTNELNRENDELKMRYLFSNRKKTIGTIAIKELAKTLNIQISTKKIKRKDYNIEIEFQIEENDFLYKIEVIKWVS